MYVQNLSAADNDPYTTHSINDRGALSSDATLIGKQVVRSPCLPSAIQCQFRNFPSVLAITNCVQFHWWPFQSLFFSHMQFIAKMHFIDAVVSKYSLHSVPSRSWALELQEVSAIAFARKYVWPLKHSSWINGGDWKFPRQGRLQFCRTTVFADAPS